MAATKGRAWVNPHYSGDEIAVGIVTALALHAIPVLLVYLKVVHPLAGHTDEAEIIARPVVAANVLKLGHPIDPKNLPDRCVPKQNMAPTNQINASSDDPLH